jgi:hypothetical protein
MGKTMEYLTNLTHQALVIFLLQLPFWLPMAVIIWLSVEVIERMRRPQRNTDHVE